MDLPTPECECGYTEAQLESILGPDLDHFHRWMYGQTQTICEGRRYNHATRSHEEACGGVAHGVVTYKDDLERFLRGLPVID